MLGQTGGINTQNVFTYCLNNPVNMVDPSGQFSMGALLNGSIYAVVGAIAIGVAITVLTGGAAAPVVIAMAVGTLAAGTVSAATGLSDMVEGVSDFNPIRDGMLGGEYNEEYATVQAAAGFAASCGASCLASLVPQSSTSTPNPNGRKGCEAHQNEIANQVQKYSDQGYQTRTEVYLETPGGYKSYRFADFSATRNGYTIYGQVGRQLLSGLPVARERYAMSDIASAGYDVYFFPYN